jgi:DNA-directed DNA polymerase III PolC
MFAHLRVHSYFSFLEGLPSPAALAQAAARSELPALALTDSVGMTGAIEFYTACQSLGIQPVLGLELEVRPPSELTADTDEVVGKIALLAADLDGWSSLCRLSSAALCAEDSDRRLDFDRLAANAGGLICLTGGPGGLCNQMLRQKRHKAAGLWLERLKELFPERLYVELAVHAPDDRPLAHALAVLASQSRLPTVVAHQIYYLSSQQAELQRTVSAMRLNTPLESLPAATCAPAQAWFLDADEMAARYREFPDGLHRSLEIAERCRLELPLGRPHFPAIELPAGQSAIDALRQKAEYGARRYYLHALPDGDLRDRDHPGEALPAEIAARLEHELAVIGSRGYEVIFLVMEQIVQFARRQGIPIASRGSASSSLVAHCLGITTPDPVRLSLYFERFLNPARLKPPDIDTDLCSRRRDEVIDFVYRRFGAERVAMVGTINRFRRRSALREAAKAHGLMPSAITTLVEHLPQRWYGPPDRFAREESPYAALLERFDDSLHRRIFQDAEALIGAPRHLSIHPGGIVIAPGNLTDLAPLQLAAKGVTITQFDLDSVERLGLVKLDLLGIRGLTVLGDVAHELHTAGAPEGNRAPAPAAQARPSKIARDAAPPPRRNARTAGYQELALAALEAIPADDPLTSELVGQGRTIGCFQIESPGMRATLREIRAAAIDDVMVALALYRPGPLTGGLKKAFVARYRGLEPAEDIHPALGSLLADTYGVILYQEQVLRIAHELAGLSLADSDLLRRAMSHFDPGKQMQQLKERFIAGAAQRSGVPAEAAEQIWQLMAAFAGYGFPKAHAASYAWVAWQSAWCKSHHPAVFLAAVLANWGGFYTQRIYLTEARRLGLAVRPPLVNAAQAEFSVRRLETETALVMGLNQVRELTRRTQERIRRHRPYRSFDDFLARADPRPGEAENLVKAGCLEGLGAIPDLLRRLKGGGWRGGQLSLFDLAPAAEDDWTLEQKARAQAELLGVEVIAHPLELHAAQIEASAALNIVEAAGRVGERVRVAGMRQTWRRSRTRRGEYVYFMTLEDLEGMLDVVIPAGVYARGREALRTAGPYCIDGMVEYSEDRGEPYLRAEKVDSL